MDDATKEIDIENCQACGEPMDVSSFAPFSEVQCLKCEARVHVKCNLGKYEITRRQGTGGMSLVFAATDTTLDRQVALKILNEDYSKDEKRILEFEKEAKITASISHPNVVRVYTVGQAYGRYYIAMELVEGESLEQRMHKAAKQDEQFITQLAIEVVAGLKAAHEEGLIHRDMKPGNVLLDSKGRAKIVDFGLALVTSGGKAIAEEIWATPYYVPPETLRMEEEDLRSDIYALGASLYHALSGKAPFTTETRSTSELLKIKKEEIPKLSKVTDGVTERLCQIIDKAMSFELGERFQSYEELLEALREAELTYRMGSSSGAVKNRKKPNTFLYLAACLIVVIATVVGWFLMQPGPANIQPTPEPVITEVDDEPKDALVDEQAKRVLIATELRNAENLLFAGRYEEAYAAYEQLSLKEHLENETVYWVGLRAAMAAYLNGESNPARKVIRQVLKVQTQGDLIKLTEADEELQRVLQQLLELETIEPQTINISGESLDVMVLLTSALKEWEQGQWEAAMQIFDEFQQVDVSSEADTSKFYQGVIEAYAADYALLKPYASGVQFASEIELQKGQVELQKLEPQIVTKGRAVYNLKQWEKQLVAKMVQIEERQAQQELEKEAARIAAVNRWNINKQKAGNALKLHQFFVVSEALSVSEAPNEEDELWRNNMLYMCTAALELYQDTYEALEKKSHVMTIRRLDGMVEYEKLLGAQKGGLLVELRRGKSEVLSWSDLSPYTMLDLHKKISLSGLDEQEKWRRRECLTCYCWLTGLDSMAEAGAEALAKVDEDFAERWEEMMKVLD